MQGYKKWMVSKICEASKLQDMDNAKICIVTPAGTIKGDYDSSPDDININHFKGLSSLTYAAYESYRSANGLINLSDNDGHINLRNAELFYNGIISHFEELAIFFDQIIGITIVDE